MISPLHSSNYSNKVQIALAVTAVCLVCSVALGAIALKEHLELTHLYNNIKTHWYSPTTVSAMASEIERTHIIATSCFSACLATLLGAFIGVGLSLYYKQGEEMARTQDNNKSS